MRIRTMNSRRTGWLMAVAVAAALGGASVTHGGSLDSKGAAIEGTWRVTVTPDAGGPPPSNSYHTYEDGGTLMQSNLTEGSAPGHGVWVQTGKRQFSLTFEKFVDFNPVLGQPGIFVFQVHESVEVDGDSYTGQAAAAFCDATGQNCISVGMATTKADRVVIEGS